MHFFLKFLLHFQLQKCAKKVHFEKKPKEQKNYNKEYKSSGKFIYSKDVLSTIKDIL